jgi:hypothetical protein
MNIYKNLPDINHLPIQDSLPGDNDLLSVNAHIHTPYSFSAFKSVQQALDMAVEEKVSVVGINDFNTTDGYSVWAEECLKRKLFPLFNIEFIALNMEDQVKGIRVNDPSNPGRTYLSGKGLAFPQRIKDESLFKLNSIKAESNKHTEKICAKLNEYLASCDAPFQLTFKDVEARLTLGNIRERHLAKALRLKITEFFGEEADQATFYNKLFSGKSLKNSLSNIAGVENEIRGHLLKAGGPAFVPESSESFLDVEDVRRIIIDAGGIPTYPFLADDANGKFTEFEEDHVKATGMLKDRGFPSVEFIPARNTIGVLEKYAGFCWDNGLIVTFGTEHNTPQMEPVKVFASGRTDLTLRLKEISHRGACVVAAHQYLVGYGRKGYINEHGIPDVNHRDEYIRLGHCLIKHMTKRQ